MRLLYDQMRPMAAFSGVGSLTAPRSGPRAVIGPDTDPS